MSAAGIRSAELDPKRELTFHHLMLLFISSTEAALIWKVFAAFSGFIHRDLNIPYITLTNALSIAALSTLIALFLNPHLIYIKTNILMCLIQISQILGLLLLWLFNYNEAAFIIGLCLLLNVFQIHWGCTNMIISVFIINNKDKQTKYLSIYNSNWTMATFLFIVTGFIIHYSFWLYLQIMLILSIIFAIACFLFLPKISIHAQQQYMDNQMHPNPDKRETETETSSMLNDFKILFVNNKYYKILFFIIILQYFIWAIFYVTFGPYLQNLFHLNPSNFGVISALLEGFGNLIAIVLLNYFSQNTLQIICISGISQFVSFIFILLLSNLNSLEFLLHSQAFVYVLILLIFLGNEGIVVGIMILSVHIAPIKQQPRSSGLLTCSNSIANFIATIIAGPLYYYHGMRIESIVILSIILFQTVFVIIFYYVYSDRQEREKMKINDRKQSFYSSISPMSQF